MTPVLVLVCVAAVFLARSALGSAYSRQGPDSKTARVADRLGDRKVLISLRGRFLRLGIVLLIAAAIAWLIVIGTQG